MDRLSFIQHNCLGSRNVFLSLLSNVSARKHDHVILCLQDLPLWKGLPPLARSFKCFHPPVSSSYKIRVAFYVAEPLMDVLSFLPMFFDQGDLMALNVFSLVPLLGSVHSRLRVYNLYNTGPKAAASRSVPPPLALPHCGLPSLVLGDFNIHHPLADPGRLSSQVERGLADRYMNQAASAGYHLLNHPGSYTRFSATTLHRHCVLDYAFANSLLLPMVDRWRNDLPPTGSDHTAVETLLSLPPVRTSLPSPDWARTPWP